MVKKRLAAVLLVRGGLVVQSRGFASYLPVGRPEIQAEFLNEWGIDEILLLSIDSPEQTDLAMVRRVAEKCLVPLTVGGGLRSLEQADQLLCSGADRVFVNSAFHQNPELVTQIARKYGDQAIVVGLDALEDGRLFNPARRLTSDLDLRRQALRAQDAGAGEILLHCIARDGQRQGYDLELIRELSQMLRVPLIALGGVGNADHIAQLFESTDASAAGIGNILHFSEHSVTLLKQQLFRRGIDVRLETQFTYSQASFDGRDRLTKKPDEELEKLLFLRLEKEVI